MAYSDSQNKATQRYQQKNLEQIRFWVQKGNKDRYKAYAENQGKSLTAFIVELIEREISPPL